MCDMVLLLWSNVGYHQQWALLPEKLVFVHIIFTLSEPSAFVKYAQQCALVVLKCVNLSTQDLSFERFQK